MAESPTNTQVLAERPDVETFIEKNEANLVLSDYVARALAQVKRDIRDRKGIKWSQVYSSAASDYFENTDGEALNRDRLHNAIILMTVAYVFKDYMIAVDSNYNGLYLEYRADYDRAIDEMKLDVDWDESGGINECEENNTTQVFLCR